jgi:hypothetical protein
VDPVRHTIAVHAATLSAFALGVEALVTFMADATVAPPNSGDHWRRRSRGRIERDTRGAESRLCLRELT